MDNAPLALGTPRLAYIATVQDEPVVRVDTRFWRNDAKQILFDGERSFAVGQPYTVGDAKHMRVDRYSRLTKGCIKYDIGRFSTDAR